MTIYTDGFTITPHDDDPLPRATSGIYVGGAGTVAVVMGNKNNTNTALTFTAVAGSILPIRAKQVKATGTSATLLVGLV